MKRTTYLLIGAGLGLFISSVAFFVSGFPIERSIDTLIWWGFICFCTVFGGSLGDFWFLSNK